MKHDVKVMESKGENMHINMINPVRHGLILGLITLIFGALWAAYLATHHEQIHGGFEAQVQAQQAEKQEAYLQAMTEELNMDDMNAMDAEDRQEGPIPSEHEHQAGHAYGAQGHGAAGHGAGEQHSHSGSLATDAMQRLLRGHIHAMGLGVLVCVLLLVVALTKLKDTWKKLFGVTLGLGAVLYPPAWIVMGFRTVELGPEAAEASIMWLFGPAVGLLLGSMIALLLVLIIEGLGWHDKSPLSRFFRRE